MKYHVHKPSYQDSYHGNIIQPITGMILSHCTHVVRNRYLQLNVQRFLKYREQKSIWTDGRSVGQSLFSCPLSPTLSVSGDKNNTFITFQCMRKLHHWPKVCGHLLILHLIPKSWALIWSLSLLCCYNSLHSSGKAFHEMLEHCCGDLLPFSHKSIFEVRH